MSEHTAETAELTAVERDTLDAILVALWQCRTAMGYESMRDKVESAVERIIAARQAGLLDRLDRAEAALAEAQGKRPSGFWSQREWEDWSNDLATLIPEDDVSEYSNPEGAQEGIISDCLAAYIAERAAENDQRRKTGGMGGSWVEYDGRKPPAVADHYAYWGDPPPARSERCAWWLRQIERGWRPSKRVRREGYDSSAQWYGVYIWEYLNVIVPAISSPPGSTEESA